MTRPEYQGRFYAAMQKVPEPQGKTGSSEVPDILKDKEKVKEMFLFSEKLKAESMGNLQKMMQEEQPFDFPIESMI
jgi:hypothetical protein